MNVLFVHIHDVIPRFFQFSSGGACRSMLSLWKHALPKVKQTNKQRNKQKWTSKCVQRHWWECFVHFALKKIESRFI